MGFGQSACNDYGRILTNFFPLRFSVVNDKKILLMLYRNPAMNMSMLAASMLIQLVNKLKGYTTTFVNGKTHLMLKGQFLVQS